MRRRSPLLMDCPGKQDSSADRRLTPDQHARPATRPFDLLGEAGH
jgi:hypothetical protein